MISLTVVFGPNGGAIQFLFKERAKAEAVLASNRTTGDDFIVIKDDFEQHAEIRRMTISGISIEDLDKSGDAVIERSIQNAKTQYKGNNKAANDPLLKIALNGNAMNHPGAPMQGFGSARRGQM